ncbi:MAG: hypothetical protein HY203_09585 [Nitrospirae bacterium]|nr:hypothetical protein [Nitrospirota bacterium]
MDDSEIALLRALMDEIFGRERFIACNVWQKRYSRENREAIGDVHEYLLVYAMDPERFTATRNRVPLTEDQGRIYKNLRIKNWGQSTFNSGSPPSSRAAMGMEGERGWESKNRPTDSSSRP